MNDHASYEELKLTSDEFQNPRILNRSGLSKKDLRELALDIARRGLLYPLLVNRDGVIIGGQRRYLAIGLIMFEPDQEFPKASQDDYDFLLARQHEFKSEGLPVRYVEAIGPAITDHATTALADNLHRAELSSFEVAERLAALNSDENGPTGVELARRIGKSKTYVSRMLKAWRGAGPHLKRAWSAGSVAYDVVKQIADLPTADQAAAVSRAERAADRAKPGPKGSHGRPGVNAIKQACDRLTTAIDVDGADELGFQYAVGARDALAYALGEPASNRLAHFSGVPLGGGAPSGK